MAPCSWPGSTRMAPPTRRRSSRIRSGPSASSKSGQPHGQRLMRIETLHARRAEAGEGLQLSSEPHAPFEAGPGHPNDGAARSGRIGQTIDAVGQHLQDVGELVTYYRGDAAQRLDVAHAVEPFGANLRN